MLQMSGPRSLLDHFSALEDSRQNWRVVYPLREILLVVLCATLAGMEDFVEIKLWADQRLGFLRRFLPYERGIPSHDTLNDLINALDPELFKGCFLAWAAGLRDSNPEIIAIDGNRLHWVLDVVFHDDLARLRSGHGPENMAVVKHMAMNLIRHPKDKHSLKSRRKLACLNDEYLKSLFQNQPALT